MTKKTKEDIKDQRLYNTYGVTLNEWEKIFKDQKGLCAICKEAKTKTGKIKILCVDHIHQKGFKKMLPEEKKKYVRGLLCFLCNTSIKWERSGKGRQTLEGMVEYFQQYSFKGEIK